jgi:hypothetical protein
MVFSLLWTSTFTMILKNQKIFWLIGIYGMFK